MSAKITTVALTDLQLSHAIAAVQKYMDELLKKADTDPEGGEHEDFLVAQSVLTAFKNSKLHTD
jgi:PDZ domain-containing secreted protein